MANETPRPRATEDTVPATPLDTVVQPSFESDMRAKAKDVLATLDELQVSASPVTFEIDGIPVTMSVGDPNIVLTIDQLYGFEMPLAWITGTTAAAAATGGKATGRRGAS